MKAVKMLNSLGDVSGNYSREVTFPHDLLNSSKVRISEQMIHGKTWRIFVHHVLDFQMEITS